MIKKRCFRCGKKKALSSFYVHPRMADGHLNKCKDCTKSDVQKNYTENREEKRAYDRKRQQDPGRIARKADYQRDSRSNNPAAYKARTAVNNAIRDGRLVRGICTVCGRRAQAHHEDYSKPFEIKWLCFKHHRELVHGQKVGS